MTDSTITQSAPEPDDIVRLLRNYKKLCVEIGRGDGYHLARIDNAIARAALSATPQAPAAPVAYRAWFDEDNGARWLFTLWPEEERLDVEWQPLYATPPAQEVQASQAAPSDALRQALSRLNSSIAWMKHGNLNEQVPLLAVPDMQVIAAALAATPAAQPADDEIDDTKKDREKAELIEFIVADMIEKDQDGEGAHGHSADKWLSITEADLRTILAGRIPDGENIFKKV